MFSSSTPELNDVDSLLAFLQAELGYCGCGYYEESLRTLRDVLQLASDRQNAMDNIETFSALTREVDAWRLTAPGLSTWFIWWLDRQDFIWHGYNPSDIWITQKGQAVLDAIKAHYNFPEPSFDEDLEE